MLLVNVYTIGKIKEAWLNDALMTYIKRLKSHLSFNFILAKDTDHLEKLLTKVPHAICFDSLGKPLTSETFCDMLYKNFAKGGSKVDMIIGGSQGLSNAMKKKNILFIVYRS